ncbi:MAG: hypothetical protein KGJ30_03390 [Burkholderiales bacterium]|nr:hypothetical protein [Burkholderiales bacterium]MDE1925992.1 hypothetical protein [Burkholderiales bacterium]MDE2157944.1 hypothetical protein [Burkholderiales bacterium]
MAGRALIVLSIAYIGLAHGAPDAAPNGLPRGAREWHFQVLLDGKKIGQHDFLIAPDQDRDPTAVRVTSAADFQVRFLGIPVYHYRIRDIEHWRGHCLQQMNADADDDGDRTQVRGVRAGDRFDITAVTLGRDAPPLAASSTGCAFSFAYWDPALAVQQALINPQTGRVERVSISKIPPTTIDVAGHATPARGIRIASAVAPIDVWYAATGGAWIGLDTTVGKSRHLSYRLTALSPPLQDPGPAAIPPGTSRANDPGPGGPVAKNP